MLITGATGTGKTELVRHASKVFFEKKPFEITGHTNMTAYELLGRTGLSQGSDLYRPSKIVQAMTADGVGGPLLYDEMNASPNEANIAIKTLLNDGPGDEVSIQMDSNENKTVGPDYSFTATVNPKSDKHKTRYEMDPAIVRIFEPMILPYMPPHEVWDTAIASMMDARGGIPLSVQDASKVLKNLCDAASWTQQAYLGQKISLDQSGGFLEAKGGASTGKQATLKDAVLDPGRVIKMLQGWSSARLEGQQFIEFLNEQLSRFANNEEYPEDDREYLRKIFGLKGFSVNTGLDEPRRIRMPHTEKSSLRPDQVARLDPYGKRTTSVARDALELLEDDFSPVFTGELAQSATVEQAKEALGKDFLGVEAVRKFEQILKEGGLDVQFNLDSIVPFPYTQKDIEFAKANNEVLTLRPDGITYKGKQMPLTVTTLKDLIGRLPEDSKLRDSFPDLRPPTIKKHWYGEEIVKPTEEWYTDKKISSDNIHSSWKLTGRDPLSQSVEQYNEWLKKRGCTQGNIPKFNELMWDMVLIFAVNGESLIKGPAYATTDFGKTVYNQEQVVVVKGIDSTGFHVAYPDHYGGYNSDFQKSGKSIYFSR